VTDPLGRTTSYAYDALNRKVQETLPNPDGVGSQEPPQTSCAYDANGNLVSTTDPLGYTTWYQYDALNRRTGVTDALGYRSGDPAHTTTTRYDALGNVAAVTDPLGRTTEYEYDNLGRKTKEILPEFQSDGGQLVRSDSDRGRRGSRGCQQFERVGGCLERAC
jgi:YD repeat-containing protein